MTDKQKPWKVYQKGEFVEMDNITYLNYLLEESRRLVAERRNREIRSLIWDFEDIKTEQYSFYRLYALQIDSEINSLKRILSLHPFPRLTTRNPGNTASTSQQHNNDMDIDP